MQRYYLIVICLIAVWPLPARAQEYFTVKAALVYLFPNAGKVAPVKKILTKTQLAHVRKELGGKDVRAEWTFYVATTKGITNGYALVDNVIGKEKPITYVVSITSDGAVKEVEILKYRESHGGQVKNKAFRKQFVGKTTADTLKAGRDIRVVSGATISSKNIAFGVKRALLVWREFFATPVIPPKTPGRCDPKLFRC